MENASKALIIAGGMLLAIMTLSLIVYMVTATSRIGKAQDEKTAAEQLASFNMQYEAYHKSVMYGTEVMSVANKAIEYNESLKNENKSIQIEIILTQDFQTTIVTTKDYIDNNREDEEDYTIESGYSLLQGTHIIKFKTDEVVENFFKQSAEDYEIPEAKEITASYIKTKWYYSALTNFKRAIFTCEESEYDETGRIKKMVFRQK